MGRWERPKKASAESVASKPHGPLEIVFQIASSKPPNHVKRAEAGDHFEVISELLPFQYQSYLDEHCADDHLRYDVCWLLREYILNGSAFEIRSIPDLAGCVLRDRKQLAASYRILSNVVDAGKSAIYVAERRRSPVLSRFPKRVALKVFPGFTDERLILHEFKTGRSMRRHSMFVTFYRLLEIKDPAPGLSPLTIEMEYCDGGTLLEEARHMRYAKAHVMSRFPFSFLKRIPLFKPWIDAVLSTLTERGTVDSDRSDAWFQQGYFNIAYRWGLLWEFGPRLSEALARLPYPHGDIKPHNILIRKKHSDRKRLAVADFGSCNLESLPSDVEVAPQGTINYIAPEVLDGEFPSRASDVYSLGATLYHILTGFPPFTGNLLEINRQHKHVQIPAFKNMEPVYSPYLHAILASAMNKDPANRPTLKEFGQMLRISMATADPDNDFRLFGRFLERYLEKYPPESRKDMQGHYVPGPPWIHTIDPKEWRKIEKAGLIYWPEPEK